MKKIFTSLLVATMVLMSGFNQLNAMSYDESYNAAKKYYQKKEVLQGADQVIAYESLGLESDSLPIEGVVSSDYASEIAKTVIALTLHGDDPRNYDGINYVQMLENCVHENGAFDLEKDQTDANFQYIGVNALYIVNSPKTELAADYLASLSNENGAFCYGGGFEDVSVTAWAVETLSLVNQDKYKDVIDHAITYIQSKQVDNGGYDAYGYGVDPNTMACVLMGLLTYDQEGIKGTTYNKGEHNPYDVLLTYQNEDGSFWYNEAGEDNEYATVQGIQAIGYYHLGSVYNDAKAEYQAIINAPIEDEKTDKPTQDEKEPNKEIKPTIKEETQNHKDKEVVQTYDSHMIILPFSMMLLSGMILIKGRRHIG